VLETMLEREGLGLGVVGLAGGVTGTTGYEEEEEKLDGEVILMILVGFTGLRLPRLGLTTGLGARTDLKGTICGTC